MKVTFSFDSDKMKALLLYAEQKGVSIETELEQATEALYQKLVPGTVKSFLSMKGRGKRSREKNLQANPEARPPI